MSERWERRIRTGLVVAAVTALAGTGCGSRVDRDRLERSLGAGQGLRPAGAGATTPDPVVTATAVPGKHRPPGPA